MSGSVGMVTAQGNKPNGTVVWGMPGWGGERANVWQGGTAVLGVTHCASGMEAGFSSRVLVAVEENLALAADASLHSRDDLRRALK